MLLLQAEAELADSTAAVGELKRRVKEQAHELAAYKVDNENKAGKVRRRSHSWQQQRRQQQRGLPTRWTTRTRQAR